MRISKDLALSLSAGVVLLATWILEGWSELSREFVVGLYLVSYGLASLELLGELLKDLRQKKSLLNIDLLMLLAAIGAAVLGAWVEGGFLLFLFSLAHALEHYAMGRARDAIKSLANLAPPLARVVSGGSEIEIHVEQVKIGDVIIVRPGERIPVDGRIVLGRSAIDQSPITGESIPVGKGAGEEVFAGTVNGEGSLEIETTRAVGDRTLDRVVKLVVEAQSQKAPTQLFTDKFQRVFVPLVLVADVLLIFIPPALGIWTLTESFYRAMTLLVAASPCALALGTPATVLAGIAQAARRGVLIKGGAHLEALGSVVAIAFDKTGTLTIGRPEVTDLVPAQGISAEELIRVAAAVERKSQHPLAEAIVRRAEAMKINLPEAGELQSTTAKGVRSDVEGRTVEIGSLRMWDSENEQIPAEILQSVAGLQQSGHSVVIVRHGEQWLGVIAIADLVREGAKPILNQLRQMGIKKIVMLTGDNLGVGKAVAEEVGVDEVKANLLPEDKSHLVKQMVDEYQWVAMVGDGVNDAPALASASVGIAMGGAGTATALETADAALMGDDLSRLPFAIALSRQSRRVIQQNVFIALGVIAVLVVASVTGLSGIGVTVVFHEGSTLVVIANALRLLAFQGSERA